MIQNQSRAFRDTKKRIGCQVCRHTEHAFEEIGKMMNLRASSRKDDSFTQMIFPQGIELAMHHPFGLENYKFSVGGFLSPQSNITYQNIWARFGSKIFVELNYINWAYGTRQASMYGISLGFPLLQAF